MKEKLTGATGQLGRGQGEHAGENRAAAAGMWMLTQAGTEDGQHTHPAEPAPTLPGPVWDAESQGHTARTGQSWHLGQCPWALL